MKYIFVQMNEKYANEIAFDWKYEGSYSFYDMTADKQDLKEFLNPKHWEYEFAVLDEFKELIGFYSYNFENGIMWIGFGLKPDLTGKGYGSDFVMSGIEFGIKRYNYDKDYLMLAVAKFNQRAIKVYQKIGFKIMEEYLQETNGGKYKFVKMKKEVKEEKMGKEIKDYTKQNKKAWDEVMPKHQAASKELLDQLFSTPGYICQKNENLLQVFDKINVQGKDIIHLCCNNGSELLSLKNMGAVRCVGIDFCDEAIDEAKEKANKFNINCEFICSDVYDISKELYESFDIVHLTAGCIGWIPNLNKFFKIIYNLLRENGVVLIHEIHPFSEMLPFDDSNIKNKLQIIEPYFRDEPIEENSSLDYVGGTDYYAETQYWFVHTISTIIMALRDNNLAIEQFSEYPDDVSAGHKKQEELEAKIPLSYILVGKKQLK